jgi:hypothetical protein
MNPRCAYFAHTPYLFSTRSFHVLLCVAHICVLVACTVLSLIALPVCCKLSSGIHCPTVCVSPRTQTLCMPFKLLQY